MKYTPSAKKINRRDFLKLAGITGSAAALAACGSQETPTTAPQPEEEGEGEGGEGEGEGQFDTDGNTTSFGIPEGLLDTRWFGPVLRRVPGDR